MSVICPPKACPIIVSASCVFYEGPNLVCSGVKTNDTLEAVIRKIDAMLCKGGQNGTSN